MRVLRPIVITVSLFFALASVAGWIRSQFRSDALVWIRVDPDAPTKDQFAIGSNAGAFVVSTVHSGSGYFDGPVNEIIWLSETARQARNDTVWEWLGFDYLRVNEPPQTDLTRVEFPYWLLVVAFATPPACWAARRLRRLPAGLCSKCGYDLRASGGQCPECGAAIPSRGIQPQPPEGGKGRGG